MEEYERYVKDQAHRSPSLIRLTKFLADQTKEQVYTVNITCIDYRDGLAAEPESWHIDPSGRQICIDGDQKPYLTPGSIPVTTTLGKSGKRGLDQLTTVPDNAQGRILLLENIDRHIVAYLAMKFDINPTFFATYIDTTFYDFETNPPPPSIVAMPSVSIAQEGVHIHYQTVLDLGEGLGPMKANVKTASNVPRSVKPTPCLSNHQLALARGCCSIIGKMVNRKWICEYLQTQSLGFMLNYVDLIFVDATTAKIRLGRGTQSSLRGQRALHGGFDDPEGVLSYSSWQEKCDSTTSSKPKGAPYQLRSDSVQESLLTTLIHYYRQPSAIFNAENPDLLSMAYHPIRITLSRWQLYTLLLGTYVKHYEYSIISRNLSIQQSSLEELQPWRRRCVRSRLKLAHLHNFISRNAPKSKDTPAGDLWDLVLMDVAHVSSQIEQWESFLVSMVPLLDTHQSLIEAQDVKRLTYIVLAFLPSSLIAGIFSMNESVVSLRGSLRIYFTVAIPATLVFLGSCFLVRKGLGLLRRM